MRTTGPLSLSPFRRLISAYVINSLGTWSGEIALAVLVLQETGSPAAVSAVFLCGQAVPALFSPALTTGLEEVRPAVSLPALLLLEALCFALLSGIGLPGLPLLLLIVAIDGVAALSVRSLTKATMLAVTEPAGLLREGNSAYVSAFTLCAAAGPVLAGLMVGAGDPRAALAFNGLTFVLAAVGLGVRARLPHRGLEVGARVFRARAMAGLAYIRERRTLRRLIATDVAAAFLGAVILPIEVVLVTGTLGADETAYGLVLSAWGAGCVAGGLLAGRLRRRPVGSLIGVSLTIIGLSYMGMGVAGSVTALVVLSVAGGVANGVEAFALMTAIQERTADAFQVRVTGLVDGLCSAALGGGIVLGGIAASLASPRVAYVLAGCGLLIAAGVATSDLRVRRRARNPGGLIGHDIGSSSSVVL